MFFECQGVSDAQVRALVCRLTSVDPKLVSDSHVAVPVNEKIELLPHTGLRINEGELKPGERYRFAHLQSIESLSIKLTWCDAFLRAHPQHGWQVILSILDEVEPMTKLVLADAELLMSLAATDLVRDGDEWKIVHRIVRTLSHEKQEVLNERLNDLFK